MAIYHCSIKIHSRGKGQSAMATAAYRSGECLTSDRTGEVFDYSRKGGVEYTEIILPEHVQRTHPEYANRKILWDAVDAIEKSYRAQVSREFEVALPKELTIEQMIDVLHEFCKTLTDQGMICDVAIHRPHDVNTEDPGVKASNDNWHAHINCTLRSINDKGEWEIKQRKEFAYETDEQGKPKLDEDGNKIRIPLLDENGNQKVRVRTRNGHTSTERLWKKVTVYESPLNGWYREARTAKAKAWRKAWEVAVNHGLEKAGIDQRVDCRTLAEQGIDRIPQIHVGPAAREIEWKQDRGVDIPMNNNGETRETIIDGFKRLRKFLKELLPMFANRNGVINNLGSAMQKLIAHCSQVIRRAEEKGVTRKEINDMIKTRNRASELIDAQIKQLEDELAEMRARGEKDRDEQKEKELYEQLTQLAARRERFATAQRDAERDRKRNSDEHKPEQPAGRTERQDRRTGETVGGVSAGDDTNIRRRR